MTPLEHTVRRAVPWLATGLGLSALLLAVPAADDPLATMLVHLAGLVLFGLGLVTVVAPLASLRPWYGGGSGVWFRVVGGVSVVVIVTGVVALVTLAGSAALRFDPSAQFLQLLSALDIAWVVAATYIGLRWLGGVRVALVGGLAMSAVCVWSIWFYLSEVGFGPSGQWVLDGAVLARRVLPFDVMAAIIAISLLLLGARHAERQAIEQLSPQS